MGIIQAITGSLSGVMADQWRELYYCDSIPADMLAQRGQKRVNEHSANTEGSDRVITDGSIIIVNEGQCVIVLEHGKVIGFCDTPGENIYRSEASAGIFSKGGFKNIARQTVERVGFGGDVPLTQTVMYLDLKEHTGNPFSLAFSLHATNTATGLDMDASVNMRGVFSFKITDPLVFYKNICGNRSTPFTKALVMPQITAELKSAAAAAAANMAQAGVAPHALPNLISELTEQIKAVTASKWSELRGFVPVSIAIESLHITEGDMKTFREAERTRMLTDPTMAAATLVGAGADAMRTVAANQSGTGAAFLSLDYGQKANNPLAPAAQTNSNALWRCSCGNFNTSAFCENCGKKRA